MTQDKAVKSAIRARMAATGEPYAEARRVILSARDNGGERGGAETSGLDAGSASAEEYYARYADEARQAGLAEAEITARLQAMAADEQTRQPADDAQTFADQMQQAADRAQDAADRAEELAEQAEEAADLAEERAGMAQEAAELAEEWADPADKLLAQQRAGRMQERSEQARELAERAREEAERAQERAELAQEAADQASEQADYDEDEDEDDEEPGGPRAGWHPQPPRPPRPLRPPGPSGQGPLDRLSGLLRGLDQLQHRFDMVRERADSFLDRLSPDRPKPDRGQD